MSPDYTENDLTWGCANCGHVNVIRIEDKTLNGGHRIAHDRCGRCERRCSIQYRRPLVVEVVKMEP